eukprot:6195554-Pleurochrysis_carterae.AAC.1
MFNSECNNKKDAAELGVPGALIRTLLGRVSSVSAWGDMYLSIQSRRQLVRPPTAHSDAVLRAIVQHEMQILESGLRRLEKTADINR